MIEYNAIDEDGNWIDQGIFALLDLEAKERKYKDWKELSKIVGCHDSEQRVNPLEVDDLITKHKPALIEQLKADKKNNK